MDYFSDTTFLGLERVSCVYGQMLSMVGHKALRFNQKYLNLCSEDKKKFLWVWNDMRVSN